MRFGPAILATNASMSGNFTSTGVDLQQDFLYSIQANYTGVNAAAVAGAGTMRLQVSNDNPPRPLSGPPVGTDPAFGVQNWTDYTGSLASTSSVAGSSSFLWNALYPGYRWVRMAYTAVSGSGIMNITFIGKG